MLIRLAAEVVHGGYSSRLHGLWRVGEVREVPMAEAARLLRDFPGLFVSADPPKVQPVGNPDTFTRPEPTTNHRQSGRKPRGG